MKRWTSSTCVSAGRSTCSRETGPRPRTWSRKRWLGHTSDGIALGPWPSLLDTSTGSLILGAAHSAPGTRDEHADRPAGHGQREWGGTDVNREEGPQGDYQASRLLLPRYGRFGLSMTDRAWVPSSGPSQARYGRADHGVMVDGPVDDGTSTRELPQHGSSAALERRPFSSPLSGAVRGAAARRREGRRCREWSWRRASTPPGFDRVDQRSRPS